MKQLDFLTKDDNTVTNEYVVSVTESATPKTFPVMRTIKATAYHDEAKNVFYFKTREIAALLGIKQQFNFTNDCKLFMGEDKVLKGNETASFRGEESTSFETFVSAEDLLRFLKSPLMVNSKRTLPGMREEIVKKLASYAEAGK